MKQILIAIKSLEEIVPGLVERYVDEYELIQ